MHGLTGGTVVIIMGNFRVTLLRVTWVCYLLDDTRR
jgi:hypothetical protein